MTDPTGLTSLTLTDDLVVGDDATVGGDLTVTGTITGDVTGDVTGAVTETLTEYADDGAITVAPHIAVLTKGTAQAMTLSAPSTDGVIIKIVSATAAAHTVTATTIGFNATDTAGDVGTFGGAIGDGIQVVSHNGEWLVLNNINVTLG